jgi:hypothetical protein
VPEAARKSRPFPESLLKSSMEAWWAWFIMVFVKGLMVKLGEPSAMLRPTTSGPISTNEGSSVHVATTNPSRDIA